MLQDIFMLGPNYDQGWVVGEGAIATTSDGGVTWTNVDVDSAFFGVGYAAYAVHFFSDPDGQEFQRGVIAAEQGRVYTTADGGMNWTYDSLELPAEDPCPALLHGENLIDWWEMDFEDPTNPASAGWLGGGVGTNRGYLYRISDWQAGTGWTWEQKDCYEFLDPAGLPTNVSGISTVFAQALLDPDAEPVVRVVTGGYPSQILSLETGTSNFDPCDGQPGPFFVSVRGAPPQVLVARAE